MTETGRDTIEAFVRNDLTTTLVCPRCRRAKTISVAKYLHIKHTIRVRCTCNTIYNVHLNFRRNFRKQVRLTGTYQTVHQKPASRGAIIINDLSRDGLSFTVSGSNRLEVGHVVLLQFDLDDREKTSLRKQAVVRSVNDKVVGCEFIQDRPLEKALAFYLRN